MSARRNSRLVGVAGGVADLPTPALIVDQQRFRANIANMQAHCDTCGINLRPHTKTHKSIRIAELQHKAGAIGICCAKLGEAEVMANGDVGSILITSPVVTPQALERLLALNEKSEDLLVVVDNVQIASETSKRLQAASQQLSVLVDIDPGMHRTGIPLGEETLELVRYVVNDCPGLKLRGVQFYSGDLMHVADFDTRAQSSLSRWRELQQVLRSLKEEDIECEIVSGGGTGTYDIDHTTNMLTELQAGSYAFMDRQYLEVNGPDGVSIAFEPSLFVLTSVVSSNHSNFATTDAGLKAFSTDAESPQVVHGAPRGSKYRFMGDEHGAIRWDSDDPVKVGTVIKCIVPHCDPTINLYDAIHVVEDDTIVDIWEIDARGRSA